MKSDHVPLLSFLAGKLAWIGLNDFDKEGTFVWSDGSPTDFKAWADVRKTQTLFLNKILIFIV